MAQRFVFRLETVLRLRQRAFEEKQRVVARRLQAIGREQVLQAAAELQVAEHIAESRELQLGGRVDVPAVQRNRAHLNLLQRRIADCARRIADHGRELERERGEMVAARVRVRALEKLRERRRTRFVEAADRNEAAEQAELALGVFRRKTAGADGV